MARSEPNVPALEGNGAGCADQVVPDRVAMKAALSPLVFRYAPTATQDVGDVQDTEYR